MIPVVLQDNSRGKLERSIRNGPLPKVISCGCKCFLQRDSTNCYVEVEWAEATPTIGAESNASEDV